jgi:hypothetical protein
MDTDWTGQPQPARDWEEIQLSIADHPDEMVLVTVVDLQTGQPVRDWTPTLNDVTWTSVGASCQSRADRR